MFEADQEKLDRGRGLKVRVRHSGNPLGFTPAARIERDSIQVILDLSFVRITRILGLRVTEIVRIHRLRP